ncbi:hypothetical protein VNO77_34475 [Canavalia gladiata]|uniref:Uncharacterized protein n=1 Tax=Canavalia gladiata TaxID=3824 RepID=A0AAN9KGH4_CANGL
MRRTTPERNFPNHGASHRSKIQAKPKKEKSCYNMVCLVRNKTTIPARFSSSETWYVNANAWSARVNEFNGLKRIPAAVTCMHGALNSGIASLLITIPECRTSTRVNEPTYFLDFQQWVQHLTSLGTPIMI